MSTWSVTVELDGSSMKVVLPKSDFPTADDAVRYVMESVNVYVGESMIIEEV